MGKTKEPGTGWEMNGIALTIDLENADDAERYETAFEQMAAEEAQIAKESRKSAQIRGYCMMYKHLFDNIFGAGTSDRLFAETPMNAAAYEDVYDSFLDYVRGQTAAAAKRRTERFGKYLPKK